MITAKRLEGNQVCFHYRHGDTVFPSPLRARKWQFEHIFGEEPDFAFLSAEEEAYLCDTFAINENDAQKMHLVEGDPCRVQHLYRIIHAMGLRVNIEEFLVTPQYK